MHAVALVVLLAALCACSAAARPLPDIADAMAGGHGWANAAISTHAASRTSRRLLQAAQPSNSSSAAVAPPTVAARPPFFAPPPPPPSNRTLYQPSFGFQFNNNVAFIGIAIVLGLAVSCFWGACGVYRRRQMLARGQHDRANIGHIPEVEPVPHDTKLTVQPIVVIQPDNQSIAYTFRELEPESDLKAAGEGGSGTAAASGSGSVAEAAADVDAGGRAEHSAGSGLAGSADGSGADGTWVSSASGRSLREAFGEAPPNGAAATGQAAAAEHGQESQAGEGRGAAVAALQDAGIMRRQKQRSGGIPQMLEWDLRAALECLDTQGGFSSEPVLSRAASLAASSPALSRAPSFGGAPSRLPSASSGGGAVSVSRSGSASGSAARLATRAWSMTRAGSGRPLSRAASSRALAADAAGAGGSFTAGTSGGDDNGGSSFLVAAPGVLEMQPLGTDGVAGSSAVKEAEPSGARMP